MSRRSPDPTPDRAPLEAGEAAASDPWAADSGLPAASQITELPQPPESLEVDDVTTELPHPLPDPDEEAPEGGDGPAVRRSMTIARKQMLRERRRLISQGDLPVVIEYDRPRSRQQCRQAKRPCLYVACRYHLYLDVNPRTGSIKINFPDKEVHQLEETCALDVAERGGVTLEEVGLIMNLTRERIRQVEASGLDKLRDDGRDLDEFLHDS